MKNKESRNLFYNGIHIELTRRCNLACAHCLRGPAQNKTMTREVIDKLIQNIDWVTQVYITGGEPLLEIDSLCYLIERLSMKIVHNITFTTNGTVKDRKVVDALEAFCIANKLNGNAMIVVSDDKFHSGEHDSAFDYYTKLANEANKRIHEARGETDDASPAIVVSSQDLGNRVMIYTGNAVKLVNQNRDNYKLDENLQIVSNYKHRIKIGSGVVCCTVYITANGDVVAPMEDDSFANYDKNAIGNIMRKPLRNILESYNDQCLLLCDESRALDLETGMLLATPEEFSFERRIISTFYIELVKLILQIRYSMKEKHPSLTPEKIIDVLPMPRNHVESAVYCTRLELESPYRQGNQLSEFVEKLGSDIMDGFLVFKEKATSEDIDRVMSLMCALAYLRTEDGQKFIKEKVLGAQLKILDLEAAKCAFGVVAFDTLPKNDKVYPCAENTGLYQQYKTPSIYDFFNVTNE